jgi:hypothetical protein
MFQKKDFIKWFVSAFSAFGIYLLMRLGIAGIPYSSPNVGPVAEASLLTRLTSIPYEIMSYFHILIFPRDLAVSQHVLISDFRDFRFWGYLGILGVLGVLGIVAMIRKRSPILLFFSLWFLGSLGLVLNIIPLDMSVAERWFYFPFIGLLGGLGILGGLGNKATRIVLTIILVAIPFWSIRTMVRNSNWHDGLTLYGHDVLVNRNAFDLHNNYGVELFRIGDIPQAKIHFQRSIELYPRWWFTYNNLGAVYEREGDLKMAQEMYEKTLTISDYYLAYENLALLYVRTKQFDKALDFLNKATVVLPGNSRIAQAMSLYWYKQNDQQKAESWALKAYSLRPDQQMGIFLKAIQTKQKIDF